jgi:cell fate regulator YaaT (PSP1 superfamily)
MYYFDPMDFDIKRGDHVVVETSRGIEYGEVIVGAKEVEESVVIRPLKGVLRLATEEDTKRYNDNKAKEKEAFSICLEKIEKHKLDMKLIEVEYTFDGNKILFYFTSDGRVDFRELVKDLAAVFRTRIELRQIGVRDESKTLGSIGVCGRNLCCSQFLGEFVPVSIKMAKEQGLSLNPSKISGACGRLMCCLKYEQDTYEELMQESPHCGAVVATPDGKGTVVSVALIRGKVRVKLESADETSIKEFAVSDVKPFDSKSYAAAADAEENLTREEREMLESLEAMELEDEQTEQKKPPKQRRQNRPQRPKEKNDSKTKQKPQKREKTDNRTQNSGNVGQESEEGTAKKRVYYKNKNNRRRPQPKKPQE